MKIMQVIDYRTFGKGFLGAALKAAEEADIIWFRIKDKRKMKAEAKKLRKALPDKFLALSADAALASELGYQAVHLGAASDIAAVREQFPQLKIGYSAHSTDEIMNKDADYYTLSPIFYTKKEYLVLPLGPTDVRSLGKEIYALGGIDSHNAVLLKGLGFVGVAGISFIDELRLIKQKLES